MENWQVYLLTCADSSLYCGITNNIESRIKAHNAGKGAKYTKGRQPLTLAAVSRKMTKSDALKFEIQIKRLPAGQKISVLKKGEI